MEQMSQHLPSESFGDELGDEDFLLSESQGRERTESLGRLSVHKVLRVHSKIAFSKCVIFWTICIKYLAL